MGQIGSTLRQAREQQGISLREAEKETKIRISYLEALENEEFDQLPGQVYAVGFLRNYARFLGIDPSPLINGLKQLVPQPEEPPLEQQIVYSHTGRRSWWPIVLIVLLLLIAAYFIATYFRSGQTTEEPIQQPANEEVNSADSSKVPDYEVLKPENEPEVQSEPIIEGLQMQVTIENTPGARCWMLIKADGSNVFEGELKAGETKEINADNVIYIRLGNAGVVNMELNGQKLDKLGGEGEVKEKTFTIDDI